MFDYKRGFSSLSLSSYSNFDFAIPCTPIPSAPCLSQGSQDCNIMRLFKPLFTLTTFVVLASAAPVSVSLPEGTLLSIEKGALQIRESHEVEFFDKRAPEPEITEVQGKQHKKRIESLTPWIWGGGRHRDHVDEKAPVVEGQV